MEGIRHPPDKVSRSAEITVETATNVIWKDFWCVVSLEWLRCERNELQCYYDNYVKWEWWQRGEYQTEPHQKTALALHGVKLSEKII